MKTPKVNPKRGDDVTMDCHKCESRIREAERERVARYMKERLVRDGYLKSQAEAIAMKICAMSDEDSASCT